MDIFYFGGQNIQSSEWEIDSHQLFGNQSLIPYFQIPMDPTILISISAFI